MATVMNIKAQQKGYDLPGMKVSVEKHMSTDSPRRIVRLPNATEIDVLRIDAKLLPGSHHLIFYKSSDTVERPTPYDCPPLDIGFGGVDLALNNAGVMVPPVPAGPPCARLPGSRSVGTAGAPGTSRPRSGATATAAAPVV